VFAVAAEALQPTYGAYLAAEDRTLVSLSPELFLRRRGRRVTTAPIKGTWPGDDPDGADALRRSSKDVAENVMIVDLMRNDLGRVCRPGTVHTPTLLDVQKRAGVWHLISTVVGELRPGVDDAELLHAVYPPGSVTGAPKVRAVAAINELEAGPRGAYTGAVGFVSPCWGVELSVAIRTFEQRGHQLELGLGGGVTADSVPMLEWQECLHKAAPLLRAIGARLADEVPAEATSATADQRAGGLLETILVTDRRPVRLADHLARLDRSAREVYGVGVPTDLGEQVELAVQSAAAGRSALRIVLDPQGQAVVSVAAAGAPPAVSVLRTVPARPGLARHKWAARQELLELESTGRAPLFIGSDGAVLETSRGNVFLLLPDGGLVTPPLRDDLLPGITRRALLDHARDTGRRVELRSFGIADLLAAPAFWTSSLSGCVPIAGVDDYVLPRHDSEISALALAVLASGEIATR
jgi:para-aminobenzoate synthetase/4-amino-4-deoxychorismate lyase